MDGPGPTPQPPFGMDIALRGLAQRGYAPSVVYDIGAAEGGWTRHAASIWPNASFVCFEPLPERAEELRQLKADFGNRVRILPCALADQVKDMTINVGENLHDSSLAYSVGSVVRRIPVTTADTLIEMSKGTLAPPNFVKIDVQGFERRVINGGAKCFRAADFVLMECQFIAFCEEMAALDETIAFMSGYGFQPYEFVEFMRRPLDGAMGQCDVLFARRDHVLVADKRWA